MQWKINHLTHIFLGFEEGRLSLRVLSPALSSIFIFKVKLDFVFCILVFSTFLCQYQDTKMFLNAKVTRESYIGIEIFLYNLFSCKVSILEVQLDFAWSHLASHVEVFVPQFRNVAVLSCLKKDFMAIKLNIWHPSSCNWQQLMMKLYEFYNYTWASLGDIIIKTA